MKIELNMNQSLDIISKTRSSLMGIAMIWVVMYHYHLESFPLNKLSRYGFTGVDIFMFLSGLGLYFSMHKNSDVLAFYKRRLLRIFPTYIFLGAIATYLLNGSHENIWHFLWIRSTLGYWTNGDAGAWFIPALITLYFFFPFLYHTIYKRDDIPLFGIIFGFVCFLTLYWVTIGANAMWFDNNDQRWLHVLLLYRVPIFLAGTFLGHILIVRRELSRAFLNTCFISLFVSPVFYLQRTTMCQSFTTTLFTPVLIIVLSFFISGYEKIVKLDRLGGVFSLVGQSSLEIYLLHIPCLVFVKTHFPSLFTHYDMMAVIIMIIAILLGLLCHRIINEITKLIENGYKCN